MASLSFRAMICLLFLMSLVTENHGADFNIKSLGAKGDGRTDDSKAIMSAWAEACKAVGASKILIPQGTYLVGPVKLQGPCKGPILIQAVGADLKAPVEVEKFKGVDGWFIIEHVDMLTIKGGRFDGQGEIAWTKNDCAKTGKCSSLPVNLRLNFLKNSVFEDVTSLNSKLFHMNLLGCANFTLIRTTVNAPAHSLNSDGIHIGRSTDVKILGADIKTGDDCISFGDGCKQVHVEKVTCGPGHGISVGSLGRYDNEEPVDGITIKNCTLTNTSNGVRIKTWPAKFPTSRDGIARGMHFEDIVMNNVGNPVLIDQEYCPYMQCTQETPSKVKISDVIFRGIRGTSSTKEAIKLVCSRSKPCDNVELGDINLIYRGPQGEAISECANVKPKLTGKIFPPACAAPHTA